MTSYNTYTPNNRRVLVVDDNMRIHDDFRALLAPEVSPQEESFEEKSSFLFSDCASAFQSTKIEYDLTFCAQGQEAYERVQQASEQDTPFALAFVDMRMPPGWDGLVTTQKLWEVDPSLQIVICSAFSDYSWEDIHRVVGVSDNLLILNKPFDPSEVYQIASALCAKRFLQDRWNSERAELATEVEERTRELMERNESLQDALKHLKSAQASLLQSEKLSSLGRLAAGIAHEINSPIQFVSDNMGFLQDSVSQLLELVRLQDSCLDASSSEEFKKLRSKVEECREDADIDFIFEEVPRAFEESFEGVGRVSNIVNSMKEFAHPGHKVKEPTDINHCVRSAMTVCGSVLKQIATLEVNLDPSEPVIDCFVGELNQVFLNLLINATQAIEDIREKRPDRSGYVSVETEAREDHVEIRIEDNGCGIPDSARKEIYDPFFTTKDVGRGSGQGLAIAYNVIVQMHGGKLRFESAEGVGTTFFIQLPRGGAS